MMKVPFVKLYDEDWLQATPEIFAEWQECLGQSQFILGEKVAEFEKKFSGEADCQFAIGVNSGLDALILGLRALGIGRGDEVITAPNSFVASAAAIDLCGATTRFADVDWDYNLSVASVESFITEKTKAVLAVHLTGHSAKLKELSEICQRRGISLIEDAAQAIGAKVSGKAVGSWGAVGCFSLHPLKNLHIWGDGGVITTNDERIYEYLIRARNHGLVDRDNVQFFSYNSRLDTLQAIVGLFALTRLNETTRRRRYHAEKYQSAFAHLTPNLVRPSWQAAENHVFHVYQVRVKRREVFRDFLNHRGIETKVHYPVPLHLQPAAKHLGYHRGDFPVAEQLSNEIVSLPVRENLKEDELNWVIESVCDFFSKQ